MTAMEMRCSPELIEAIHDSVRDADSSEACGLVLGVARDSGFEATSFRPLPNRAAEHLRAFELDPIQFLEVEAEARAIGLILLGLLHSHPRGGTRPSRRDLAADWPAPTCWITDPDGRIGIWRRGPDRRPIRLELRIVPA